MPWSTIDGASRDASAVRCTQVFRGYQVDERFALLAQELKWSGSEAGELLSSTSKADICLV
eukprot:7190693-Pyramimonas_sp.AAC.1